ncbi:MAG: LON peptidase substrate-binding domain-containing protein [Acidimicrobiales bacterium]|nr:LON peptidase substrate-binding domain-containing protein [Acidimicrobiales bacterium]
MGVVLIERGSEVGGGDTRVSTGTVAHLIESERLPDGRWVAIIAGSHRFTVERWLPDDPYPQAMVTEHADQPWDPACQPLLEEAEQVVRHALHLASELGETAGPPGFKLAADPAVAAWELCGRAPLGALDRQRLLEEPEWTVRLERLRDEVEEAVKVLAFRLHGR